MRIAKVVGVLVAVAACTGQLANLGGTDGGANGPDATTDGSAPTGRRSDGGAIQDAGTAFDATGPHPAVGGSWDGSAGQPASCTSTSDCTAPFQCFVPPGQTLSGAAYPGFCVPPCISGGDCQAWLTCQGGACVPVTSCAAGQSLMQTPTGETCDAAVACGSGGYCTGASPPIRAA